MKIMSKVKKIHKLNSVEIIKIKRNGYISFLKSFTKSNISLINIIPSIYLFIYSINKWMVWFGIGL